MRRMADSRLQVGDAVAQGRLKEIVGEIAVAARAPRRTIVQCHEMPHQLFSLQQRAPDRCGTPSLLRVWTKNIALMFRCTGLSASAFRTFAVGCFSSGRMARYQKSAESAPATCGSRAMGPRADYRRRTPAA